MTRGKTWMWSEALDLLQSAERLQRQFFRPGTRNCWEPPVAQGAAIHRLEIPYGPFERRIALSDGHYQILQKVFDNGCLVIGLRRLEGKLG